MTGNGETHVVPSRFSTYGAAADERTRRGPREIGSVTHTDMCDGFDCPCYKDGWFMEATRHLDVLDQFCKVDPDLVRERMALWGQRLTQSAPLVADDEVVVLIDGMRYVVKAGTYTGAEIRGFRHPPIGADRDLWLPGGPLGLDTVIEDDTTIDVRSDLLLITSTRFINGG